MYYLIFLGALSLFIGTILLVHFKFPNKKHLIIERILPFVLIAIVAVRFMSYKDIQFVHGNDTTYSLYKGPMNGFFNTIGNLSLWLETTALLLVLCRPWVHFKTAKFYVKFIALPILTFSAIALYPTLMMMQGHDNWSVLTIMLPIELGGLIALALYYLSRDWDVKISRHSYAEVAVFSSLINLATMPCFIPNFFFGSGLPGRFPYDLTMTHRIFLYVSCVILPLGIYFALRNAHQDKIRYTLIIISLGTFMSYFVGNKYDTIFTPWEWPLHLCNLAMILIPLCFIFKLKRLFYFTYFINVFGALLAMLMPNYNEHLRFFTTEAMYFWINHCCAFMMPLLGVALYEFDRPKIKQFLYSSIWFLAYFIFVLTLNTLFSAFQGTQTPFGVIYSTDYFFINSDFIADKLGKWAENIFRASVSFQLNGRTMTLRPAYQAIYYVVYALVGFGVWFLYQLMFDIADAHKQLHTN